MTGSKLQWKEIQFLKREDVEIVTHIKILKYYCPGSSFGKVNQSASDGLKFEINNFYQFFQSFCSKYVLKTLAIYWTEYSRWIDG